MLMSKLLGLAVRRHFSTAVDPSKITQWLADATPAISQPRALYCQFLSKLLHLGANPSNIMDVRYSHVASVVVPRPIDFITGRDTD
jgi:hypothetical protein